MRCDCRSTGAGQSSPSHRRSSKMAALNSGRQRVASMSSIRTRKRPIAAFALSCATIAAKAWPRCSNPVGLGAKRVTIIAGVYIPSRMAKPHRISSAAQLEQALAELEAADARLAAVLRSIAKPKFVARRRHGFEALVEIVVSQQLSGAAADT